MIRRRVSSEAALAILLLWLFWPSTTNAQEKRALLLEGQVIQWDSPDGMKIKGIFMLPPGYRKENKLPLILQIHGGPSGYWANAFGGHAPHLQTEGSRRACSSKQGEVVSVDSN